ESKHSANEIMIFLTEHKPSLEAYIPVLFRVIKSGICGGFFMRCWSRAKSAICSRIKKTNFSQSKKANASALPPFLSCLS
ncbi:MAG: hypothetical protein LUG93_02305, partial [Lachnospiraceae bacterium]|nr:hypothetical protein [Lachnospiraceae bacterium]